MKRFIILIAVLFSVNLSAQHKIGIRAGLNYSTFDGPLEQNESYGISSGFHFGINYTYLFNDKLSFRGELLYIQRGSKQSLIDTTEGTGGVYYIINPFSGDNLVAQGKSEYNLDITNGYLSIPLTAHYRINSKWEAFGGFSIDFLIGPSARGKVNFTVPDQFFFQQSFDFRYNSDEAGGLNQLIDFRQPDNQVIIDVDGNSLIMPRVVTAYYNFTEDQKTGNRFKGIDAHLTAGMNYFINPGFYVGARIEYGINDITNNGMDISLRELDADNNFIFRDDNDRSISLGLSFGFRF